MPKLWTRRTRPTLLVVLHMLLAAVGGAALTLALYTGTVSGTHGLKAACRALVCLPLGPMGACFALAFLDQRFRYHLVYGAVASLVPTLILLFRPATPWNAFGLVWLILWAGGLLGSGLGCAASRGFYVIVVGNPPRCPRCGRLLWGTRNCIQCGWPDAQGTG